MKGDIDVLSSHNKGTIFWWMFKSPNLDFKSHNYDESEEQLEEVKVNSVYSVKAKSNIKHFTL